MAVVSFRLFCKNLGHLREFFGQMVYRPPPPPPLAKNFPYAYGQSGVNEMFFYIQIFIKKSYDTLIKAVAIGFHWLYELES